MLVFTHIDLFLMKIVILLAQEILDEQKENFNSLHFVTALWRHGARTPTILMGNNKENNDTNLLGLGELTTKGFAQCYKLGKWIRKRYNKFLSRNYNPFEFFVRSSDFNRTLMSGQAVMAAIYLPEKSVGDWLAIPIHTTAKSNDKLIFDTTECQKIVYEEKRIFLSAEAKQIEKDNMVFLEFLSEKSRYNGSFLPLREIRFVFDPLYCNLENGDTIPNWINESVKHQIWSLYDLSSALLFSTELSVHLKAGRLFTEIISRMESILNDKADKRLKFYAYSAHDTTLAGILATFGVRPPIFPRFSSLVLIELHKIINQNWIRLLYKNDTKNDELWEWPIEGCPSPCSLQKLKSARRKFLIQEENDECFESEGMLTCEKIYLSLIVLLSLISATLAIYIILGNHQRQKMSRSHYLALMYKEGKFRSKMDEKNQAHVGLLNSYEEEIELNSSVMSNF